jgi:hypothetical protein
LIVILDTNALHGDVHAARGHLATLLDHARFSDYEVWLPSSVLGELVRQYPIRLERLGKVYSKIKRDLRALQLGQLEIPARPFELQAEYERELRARFSGPGLRVAEHPPTIGKAFDWIARRRHPIKEAGTQQPVSQDSPPLRAPESSPVFGAVDAAVWLTVIETARTNRVALITANTNDFAAPEDPTALHPLLVADLESAGVNPDKVVRFDTVAAFNNRYVRTVAENLEAARAFLANDAQREALEAAIAAATEWFPLRIGPSWGFSAAVHDAVLSGFRASDVELVRADRGPSGLYLTLSVPGTAELDLGVPRSEAVGLPPDDAIQVWDWNWHDSMVHAAADVPAVLSVEVLVDHNHGLAISIDEIKPR